MPDSPDLPDMNGLQMLKEARERGSMTKVVILTAYSDFDYAKKAIALGIENYLLKPVNLTELKNTLSKIKEEIFVEQRGKNSLSLETVIKDALEGEYEEDSRLEETLLEKYGFSGRKQIYCMYLFMGKYYDSVTVAFFNNRKSFLYQKLCRSLFFFIIFYAGK